MLRQGVFLDLTDRLCDADLDDFYPGPLKQFRWQDKLWGLADTAAPELVFYNKAMFDAAGLAYPTDNWTFEEMRQAAIQVSPDHARDRPGDDRAAVMPGGTGEMDPLGRRQQGPSRAFSPASPVNLTGEWMVTNTVVETSHPPYRDLRLGFRLVVQHDGVAFTGTGEKYLENGRQIPVTARSPIRLQGRMVKPRQNFRAHRHFW